MQDFGFAQIESNFAQILPKFNQFWIIKIC